MKTPLVAVLNGPNLSQLGRREAEHYPALTLAQLDAVCVAEGEALGLRVVCHQTEAEGELVALIHRWGNEADALVVNAAAYTHTSVAVRDALLCVAAPVVEVHLSNPDAREPFRRRNLLRDVVAASVNGFGVDSYRLALRGVRGMLAGDNA